MITCTRCGSDKLQAVTETHESGGFDNKAACIGGLCLGPIGLLFGNKKKIITHKTLWICASCGNKFELDDQSGSSQSTRNNW